MRVMTSVLMSPCVAAKRITAAASIVRNAWAKRVIETSSSSENDNSRSPSSAIDPAASFGLKGTPTGIERQLSTPTGTTSPGAIGARRTVEQESAGPSDTMRPPTSRRPTGCSNPATAAMPMDSGSAKVTNSSLNVSPRQRALAPTKRSVTKATSTSAISSGRPAMEMSKRLLKTNAWIAGTCRVTASPTASPVTVGSRCSGKALLVPVEMPARGTEPHSLTTARCVPSPPSTTIAATPAWRMSREARSVS